ncbi:MAG: RNA-binding protein [Bdellovibrionota bacterium]
MRYKVVETSVVTDEAIENILNEWGPQGWHLESIQFVRSDASRRPSMAFVLFYRDEDGEKKPE